VPMNATARHLRARWGLICRAGRNRSRRTRGWSTESGQRARCAQGMTLSRKSRMTSPALPSNPALSKSIRRRCRRSATVLLPSDDTRPQRRRFEQRGAGTGPHNRLPRRPPESVIRTRISFITERACPLARSVTIRVVWLSRHGGEWIAQSSQEFVNQPDRMGYEEAGSRPERLCST
jgi:hypothetical protein